MPIEVATDATEEPMLDAILVMFGIMFASNFNPTEFDRYVPNCVNLSCKVGSIDTSSENIGLICVMNKYITKHIVARLVILDNQLNICQYVFSDFVCGVLNGKTLR